MWDKMKKTAGARLLQYGTALRKHGDKFLFAAALIVLAAVLFRPGTKAEKAVAQITASNVVFTHWWRDDLESDTLPDLVKEFESLHDNIKIVLNEVSYESLRHSLFNPGEIPPGDVLALDPLWVPELTERETVEDSGGPLLSFINVLYYNTNILKEAGFIRPPKNRSEFLEYAKAAAGKEENRPGLAMDKNSSRLIYEDVYSWIWAAGARLVEDGKPAVDSRAVTESLSFLAALSGEGLIAPGVFSAGASADTGTKLEDFISGRAAFMIAPAGNIRYVSERMGKEAFSVSAVPAPDNHTGQSFFGTAAWSLGIFSGSPCKEEAKLFMTFLAGKAPLLSEKARAIPGNAVIPPGPDPLYSKVWDIAIAGESARDFSGIAREQELEEIFREELSVLFSGASGPAETAGAIQKRWSAVFSEM